eukprot:6201648-Pleurochrysis_carterae.AAC.6
MGGDWTMSFQRREARHLQHGLEYADKVQQRALARRDAVQLAPMTNPHCAENEVNSFLITRPSDFKHTAKNPCNNLVKSAMKARVLAHKLAPKRLHKAFAAIQETSCKFKLAVSEPYASKPQANFESNGHVDKLFSQE